MTPWRELLKEKGYDASPGILQLLATENERPVDVSVSNFLTNQLIEWIGEQDSSWFAHASFLRPHPPYSAAGEYSTMYAPDSVGQPIQRAEEVHAFHEVMLMLDGTKAPTDPDEMAHMRAQYFGMISEVDYQLGRLFDSLVESGEWDNTVIVITADHAEMLGDHGLREKVGYWETSQHIIGIVADPRRASVHGTVVDKFTENIDIMPTLCDVMEIAIPAQCDGLPLTHFINGTEPPWWRDAAHWEYDWRFALIPSDRYEWPWRRRLEQLNLAVRRSDTHAYVQFGDGDFLCFDLAADDTWRTMTTDDAVISENARAMLTWRMEHANRDLTGFLVEQGGVGRWPSEVSWRETP
jgi:arylsulfatase A-like enzyme